MALKWNYHSDSLTQAKYAKALRDMQWMDNNGTVGGKLTTGPTGTFGGTYLDMTGGPRITWPGLDNGPVGSTALTIMVRVIPVGSGAPASRQALIALTNADWSRKLTGSIALNINTLGQLTIDAMKFDDTAIFTNVSFGTALTFVANQPTDIWFVWDGTTTANHVKCYQAQNGATASLVATLTASVAAVAYIRALMSEIRTDHLFDGVVNSLFHINEAAIWDTAEDPTTYGTRTDFITNTAFEGYTSADPGIANVRSGTSYTINGNPLTGTAAIPAAADVRLNTAVGSTTGLLNLPAVADVRLSALFDNGTKTGTLNLATAANLKHGVTQDNGAIVGTYRGADLWTAFTAGQIALGQSSLQDGVTVTGTGVLAAAATTKHGVTANDGAGTYRGADLWTDAGAANVFLGLTYLADGVLQTGLLDEPAASVVKIGTTYYEGQRVGTYDGSDRWSYPGDDNVSSGVTSLVNGVTHTGTRQTVTNTMSDLELILQPNAIVLELD